MPEMNLSEFDSIIAGFDPGTNLMGYGILGVKNKRPYMIAMGVIKLSKFDNHYIRLHKIHQRVVSIVDDFKPTEIAIEAPFFGKNVQSMLKLGRAQGVAIAAALTHNVPIAEYEPRKVKQAITGNGGATKEQVKEMLKRILNISEENILPQLDATDALAVALCHYYEISRPMPSKSSGSWADFVKKNPDRIK